MSSQPTMLLEIVSAEAEIFSDRVVFVAATGRLGEIGIYPGHTALLTSLVPGIIRAQLADGKEEIFYMSGGMLEVQPEVVTVLADTAERAANLDESAAKFAKEKAEKILAEKKAGFEYSQALAELAEAAAQLRAIQTLRRKMGREGH